MLPAPPTTSTGLQLEHGLTSLELKHMGRDTIAGLIAGILQKYTKKEDVSVYLSFQLLMGVIFRQLMVKGDPRESVK